LAAYPFPASAQMVLFDFLRWDGTEFKPNFNEEVLGIRRSVGHQIFARLRIGPIFD
jgi:hypothetical protein